MIFVFVIKRSVVPSFICFLYVDDMLIAARDIVEINTLKPRMSSEFDMKNLRAAKKISEMKIHRNKREERLFLSFKKIHREDIR